MIYLELLLTFFKIGLFSFGGGYGMIPLIEHEIIAQGWLTSQEFVDIIAVSEMTPGPIAVNSATFIGYRIGGIPGGVIATTGTVMPSLILILIASFLLSKFRYHKITESAIYGIRPVVLALVVQAAIFVAGNTFFNKEIIFKGLSDAVSGNHFLEIINPASIVITAVSLILLLFTKIHPILVIIMAGTAGVILHYAGVL